MKRATTIRPTLRSPSADADLARDGFVVLPLLDAEEVARLRSLHERWTATGEINPPGAYDPTYAEFSVIHSDPVFRREAYRTIDEVVVPRAGEHLVRMRPLVANYVNKPPGTGVVPVHQNWAVVDEEHHRSVSVWVALGDMTVANGTLQVVPGSHRELRGPRGMWAYQAFVEIEDAVRPHLEPVEVRAGEAIVLDDALIHYSPPNETDEPRLAIQLVMVPDEADARFYQQVEEAPDGGLVVDVWEVAPPFFWDFWHGDGDTAWGTRVDRIHVDRPSYDRRTFRRRVGRSTLARARRRRSRSWRAASSSNVRRSGS